MSSCSDQSEVSAGGRRHGDPGGPIALPPRGGPWPGPRATLAQRPGGPGGPGGPGPKSAGCGGRGPFWRRRCCYCFLGRVGGVGVPVYLRTGVHSRARGFPSFRRGKTNRPSPQVPAFPNVPPSSPVWRGAPRVPRSSSCSPVSLLLLGKPKESDHLVPSLPQVTLCLTKGLLWPRLPFPVRLWPPRVPCPPV